jgi:Rad3-related DNA helicase
LPHNPAEEEDIALVFAPGGPVAHLLGDSYRPRHGQARMARLVKRALVEEQHVLVEAGTGSGKSFAYLIPLIWSSSRAFISTANKTLQNQLWEKDLPALQRIAPQPFAAALLKGRGNYVCRIKLRELGQQLTLPGHGLSFGDLLDRLEQVPSGDVEELRLFGAQREALTADQHDCLGHRCPLRKECYYEMARLWAEEADLVVVNHALLAANLVLDNPILQPRDVVIIDEAQEFERYIVGALRLSLEYDGVPSLANDAVVIRNADESVRGKAVRANHQFFTDLSHSADQNWGRRWAAPLELPLAQTLALHVNAIHKQLLKRYPPLPGAGEHNEENARHQQVLEWTGQLANEIQVLGQPVPDDAVRYCERIRGKTDQARVGLYQEPVEVADFLKKALWEAAKTVVCTTATLAVNQQFDYFRQRTGAPQQGIHQRIFASPFDFAHQALLYTPHGLYPQYDAGEEAYVEKLAAEVERLVQASRGRAFVLCTSMRRAEQLFELLASRLPYSCYRQGTAPRNELLDLFRNDASGAVLFATKSFWEGVDVPGEALSLVIIDKLPFAPHYDPVIQHRGQRIRDAGGNPFVQYTLPEATLALKQGVGRLIRTETDRGVMAILDSRINTKRYGPQMIASLPRARRTLHFEDVQAFFEKL